MKKKKGKHRKKGWMISGICLLLVVGLLFWQWEIAKAVFLGIFFTEEQRIQMVEEKEQKVQAILAEIPDVDVMPLPPNTEKLIVEGIISEEEAMSVVQKETTIEDLMDEKGVAFGEDERGRTIIVVKDETGEYVPYKSPDQLAQPPTENTQSGAEDASDSSISHGEIAGPQKPLQKDTPSKQSPRLQELIAKIYVLRSTYIGRIDALVKQARHEYHLDKSRKSELEGKYLRIGSNMEKECDAQMEAIISEIHAELIRTGGDLSLIDEIRAAYAQEKSAKKAALFAKYAK